MPRPSVIERARMYVSRMPIGVSGSGRHTATVNVANALIHGFSLADGDAWSLLSEYNATCQPPSEDFKLRHRFELAKSFDNEKSDGWLLGDDKNYVPGSSNAMRDEGRSGKKAMPPPAPEKPTYDEASLRRFAKGWEQHVDLLWLANRSALDPATVTTAKFLDVLYHRAREHVVVFTTQESQGQALWPRDELPPIDQPRGAWFMCQPVDGGYYPNYKQQLSRRSKESVLEFRYLVIESDTAPARLWLAALAQLPLRVAAIYSSGGRSVHALVRVDCPTKDAWDDFKTKTKVGLIHLGADPGALSAVRLTRLPGYIRREKNKPGRAALQKLLYLNPEPVVRALTQMPVLRDVEETWCAAAAAGVADGDETGGRWIERGLGYYAPVSAKCATALDEFKKGVTV